jgi:hypothetical protein
VADIVELQPNVIPTLQKHLVNAAEQAESKVETIMRSYTSTVGNGWSSAAANAALNVQLDENKPKWKRLMDVLEEVSEALHKAAGMSEDQIDDGRRQIEAEVAANNNDGGSAMATNYQSRLNA